MILIDTSIWVEFFRSATSQNSKLVANLVRDEEVIVGDLILVEVLQGARTERELHVLSSALSAFAVRTLCGAEIATQAASNYRLLRNKGITVRGTIDVVIATWCIFHNARLLHNDRDFASMGSVLGLKSYAETR